MRSTNRVKQHLNLDKDGNTALHKEVSKLTNLQSFRHWIKTLDPKDVSKMARTINNNGCLPLDLVNACQLGDDEKEALYNLMVELAIQHPYKDLSHQLTEEKLKKVVDRYAIEPNSSLYHNMQIAFDLVNKVRNVLIKSNTSPVTNSYQKADKLKLNQEIEEMHFRFWKRAFYPRNIIRLFTNPKSLDVEIKAEEAIKSKIGTCEDFAKVAWYFLKEKEIAVAADLWRIQNGDHIFLVIGKGDDRVVCDAWSGKIYPFTAIEQELKAFRCIGYQNTSLNVCTFFNSKVHEVQPKINNLETVSASCTTILGVAAIVLTATVCQSLHVDHDTFRII